MNGLKKMRVDRGMKQKDVVKLLKTVERRMNVPLFSAVETGTVLPTTKQLDVMFTTYFATDRPVRDEAHRVERRLRALGYSDTYKLTVRVPTRLINGLRGKLDGQGITEWVLEKIKSEIEDGDRTADEAETIATEERKPDTIISLFERLSNIEQERLKIANQIKETDSQYDFCMGNAEIHLFCGIKAFLSEIGKTPKSLTWSHDIEFNDGKGHHVAYIMWNGFKFIQLGSAEEELG